MKPPRSFLDVREQSMIDPMPDKTTDTFIRLVLAEQGREKAVNLTLFPDGEDLKFAELDKDFGFQVMKRRLLCCAPETQVTLEALLMALILSDSPAKIVMWAYTYHRLYQDKKKLITLGMLADEFPFGFPNATTWKDLWKSQKLDGDHPLNDNALDDIKSWA